MYIYSGICGTRGRSAVRYSFILIALLGIVYKAGAAQTKKEDYKEGGGREELAVQYERKPTESTRRHGAHACCRLPKP